MNMHARIMNIQCNVPAVLTKVEAVVHKVGHRDARHAAAEIALGGDALIAELLAALEVAAEYIALHSQSNGMGLRDHDHDKYERVPLLEQLRAAIAKAKGQS